MKPSTEWWLPGPRGRGAWGERAQGQGLLLWSDGHALETGRGGGCPILNTRNAAESFTICM